MAAAGGSLECLEWLHGEGCKWDRWTTIYAAQNGHLDCLQYAHTHGCPWDAEVCARAAQNGSLDCLQYAHNPPSGDYCPWNESVYLTATYNGHLNCLRYVHSMGCPWPIDFSKAIEYAKSCGYLDCVEYITMHCPEN